MGLVSSPRNWRQSCCSARSGMSTGARNRTAARRPRVEQRVFFCSWSRRRDGIGFLQRAAASMFCQQCDDDTLQLAPSSAPRCRAPGEGIEFVEEEGTLAAVAHGRDARKFRAGPPEQAADQRLQRLRSVAGRPVGRCISTRRLDFASTSQAANREQHAVEHGGRRTWPVRSRCRMSPAETRRPAIEMAVGNNKCIVALGRPAEEPRACSRLSASTGSPLKPASRGILSGAMACPRESLPHRAGPAVAAVAVPTWSASSPADSPGHARVGLQGPRRGSSIPRRCSAGCHAKPPSFPVSARRLSPAKATS